MAIRLPWPRGLVIDGVERREPDWSEEAVTVATLCDQCGAELPVGATARLHHPSGQLYCADCSAL